MTKQSGYTVLEFISTVFIIAIILAIIIPTYDDYQRAARREDAKRALVMVQSAQDIWRSSHSSYAGNLSDLGLAHESENGYYSIFIRNSNNAGFVAQASPRAGSIQENDHCIFYITEQGPDLSSHEKKSCWGYRNR